MAETKKTEAAAAAAPPEAACLTLRQKLVEMRKACPEIVKKQHSDGVSYKYAKIYDVWEKITPIMNELGVDFDVISEQATRHAENGDPVYWITMQTKTRNGDKLMFLYRQRSPRPDRRRRQRFPDPVAEEADHRGTAQGADRVGKDRRRCR